MRKTADRIWQGWGALARRPVLAVCLAAAFSLAANLVSFRVMGFPQPRIHDEFAYLLAADTFAHGRLTNPPHPLWQHFETFQVIQQPTYMSKYPPGTGLMMAAGQVVLGHPAFGVWLQSALLAGAVTWMLFAWMPPRWALLGGFLAAVHFGFANYWSCSYWGGSLAAFGGALVWGAVRRIWKGKAMARSSLLLGTGLAVLAITRPYEGLVTAVPAAIVILVFFLRNRQRAAALIFPAALVLGLAAAGLAIYNKTVTGNPWTMPFIVWDDQYSTAPLFSWQQPKPPIAHRHKVFQDYDEQYTRRWYERRRSVFSRPEIFPETIGMFWLRAFHFYFTPLLWIPLVAILPRWHANRRVGFVLLGVLPLLIAAVAAAGTFSQHHYYAPAAPLFLLLVCEGLRYLRAWRVPQPFRRYRNLMLLFFLAGVLFLNGRRIFEPFPLARPLPRTPVETEIKKTPGTHLVLVRYAPDHWVHQEWVYNGADIDASPIVWARAMGPGRDEAILEYYPDRHVWIVEPDFNPFRLEHVRNPLTRSKD